MNLEERIQSTQPLSLDKKVNLNLILAGDVVRKEVRQTLKPFGLSIPQFNVLRILRGQNGKPANLKTLHKRMVHQSSNTTRIVDKLVEKALVERCVCSQNRRQIEVKINDEGLKLLEETDTKVKDAEIKTTASLDREELDRLNTLLEKFLT